MIIPPADKRIRAFCNGVCGHAKGGECLKCRAFPFADEAEQQMLTAHIVVSHRPRRLLRQSERAFCTFGAPIQKAHAVSFRDNSSVRLNFIAKQERLQPLHLRGFYKKASTNARWCGMIKQYSRSKTVAICVRGIYMDKKEFVSGFKE